MQIKLNCRKLHSSGINYRDNGATYQLHAEDYAAVLNNITGAKYIKAIDNFLTDETPVDTFKDILDTFSTSSKGASQSLMNLNAPEMIEIGNDELANKKDELLILLYNKEFDDSEEVQKNTYDVSSSDGINYTCIAIALKTHTL